jgi:hypothetical protein
VRKEREAEKDEMQKTLLKLTDALGRDSASMRIIAILTAFFLPFTFMAVSRKLQFFSNRLKSFTDLAYCANVQMA